LQDVAQRILEAGKLELLLGRQQPRLHDPAALHPAEALPGTTRLVFELRNDDALPVITAAG
jgi:hypothetical protein